jgi:hypothetical protein
VAVVLQAGVLLEQTMLRMSRCVTLALLVSTTSAFPSFVTRKKITSLNMSTGESTKVIEVVSQPDEEFLEKKGCDFIKKTKRGNR